MTPGDLPDHLTRSGISDSLAHECAELLERCAAAEFGFGVSAPMTEELTRAAKQLMDALERPGRARSLLGRLALAR